MPFYKMKNESLSSIRDVFTSSIKSMTDVVSYKK